MPYIELKTNKQLSRDKKEQILRDLTALMARDLGKPEKYIMASCLDDQDMIFAGSHDPLVFVDLRSIRLPEGQTENLSKSLSNFMANNLAVKGERLFINFSNFDGDRWGHNGSTF